jgi:hypothetical protein
VKIGRRCLRCGQTAYGESYCPGCRELVRAERQPYAAAYQSPQYRAARRERIRISGGVCEVGGCYAAVDETHHVVPLSRARTLSAAIALCTVENLRAVCFEHNPRGGVKTR